MRYWDLLWHIQCWKGRVPQFIVYFQKHSKVKKKKNPLRYRIRGEKTFAMYFNGATLFQLLNRTKKLEIFYAFLLGNLNIIVVWNGAVSSVDKNVNYF